MFSVPPRNFAFDTPDHTTVGYMATKHYFGNISGEKNDNTVFIVANVWNFGHLKFIETSNKVA